MCTTTLSFVCVPRLLREREREPKRAVAIARGSSQSEFEHLFARGGEAYESSPVLAFRAGEARAYERVSSPSSTRRRTACFAIQGRRRFGGSLGPKGRSPVERLRPSTAPISTYEPPRLPQK